MKVKSLSRVRLFPTPWTAEPTRLRRPWDFPGKSTGVGCHRPLRRRLVLGSHSAQTPLLLTEILIHLMIGGGEDTRGDGFAVLTYGEPMGATLLLLHSSFPCPVYFSPCSPHFFFFFFAMLAQMRKFQVQTMGPFHHCSPAASFQCSPTVLYTPVLIISGILFIS